MLAISSICRMPTTRLEGFPARPWPTAAPTCSATLPTQTATSRKQMSLTQTEMLTAHHLALQSSFRADSRREDTRLQRRSHSAHPNSKYLHMIEVLWRTTPAAFYWE